MDFFKQFTYSHVLQTSEEIAHSLGWTWIPASDGQGFSVEKGRWSAHHRRGAGHHIVAPASSLETWVKLSRNLGPCFAVVSEHGRDWIASNGFFRWMSGCSDRFAPSKPAVWNAITREPETFLRIGQADYSVHSTSHLTKPQMEAMRALLDWPSGARKPVHFVAFSCSPGWFALQVLVEKPTPRFLEHMHRKGLCLADSLAPT